ncbi:hypothetical protein KKE06_00100 [Candidatus Micrarchaeota archaeon]|nr:hypothetical protein [Candidatus Micrarchaeota archaeon]MBU1931049.1 hypothetical protein [Candidatus Micrarchaeota archaeon]
MARIEKKDNIVSIVLDEKESRAIGLENGEFECFQPKKGLLVLTEKQVENIVPEPDPIDGKLLEILSDRKMLSRRIVGKFEKTLNPAEKKRLEELEKEGIVERFKLSAQYKNAVYRLKEKKVQSAKADDTNIALSKPNSSTFSVSKPSPQPVMPNTSPNLDKDGFIILKSGDDAYKMSSERYREFKNGSLRGLKSFDGSFSVIQEKALKRMQPKILDFLKKQKKADLQTISKNTQLRVDAIRVACEFLKEDGQIFEKTKHQYCLV